MEESKMKTERNLDIGSTNYAKDEGDSIYFIQWNDDRLNPRIPKTELNAILDEAYDEYPFGSFCIIDNSEFTTTSLVLLSMFKLFRH